MADLPKGFSFVDEETPSVSVSEDLPSGALPDGFSFDDDGEAVAAQVSESLPEGFELEAPAPDIPIEQRPFVVNTLRDPDLSDDQRLQLIERYGETYSAKLGADTDSIDSFKLHFRNSWDNYNTLGATMRRDAVSTEESAGVSAKIQGVRDEMARRKREGIVMKKGDKVPVLKVLAQRLKGLHKGGDFQGSGFADMSDESLEARIIELEAEEEEARSVRFTGLLNEATKQAEFDALDSQGLLENAAAVAGTLGGGAVDPINAVPFAKPVQGLSLTGRLAMKGVQGAALNAAVNPLLQEGAVEANAQAGFEWGNFFADAGFGGLAVGGFSALGELGSSILKRFKVDPSVVAGKSAAEALEVISKETGESAEDLAKVIEVEMKNPELKATVERLKAEAVPTESSTGTARVSEAIPEGSKQRGFSERLKGDENFNADEIAANPREHYVPQADETIEEIVANMDDIQLGKAFDDVKASAPSGENFSTLAGIEKLRRAVARGEDTTPIREALSKRGTSLGQLVQQFSRWKTTTPEGLLGLIEAEAKQIGRQLPEMAKKRGTTLAKRQLDTAEALRQAEAKHLDEFTDATAKEYATAQKAAAKAAREFDGFGRDMVPQGFWKTLGTTVKGNLLTSESLIVNVLGNAAYYPVRKAKGAVATGLDQLWALASKQRTHKEGLAKTRGELVGAAKGVAEGVDAMIHGGTMDDYLKAEVQRGFRPLRAMQQAFAPSEKGILPVKSNGKVSLTDRARKLVEGLIGAPPEAMFRLLQLGDKPFRASAYRGAVEELGALKGLKGKELDKFIFHPDEASRTLAATRGDAAVFMKDGSAGKAFRMLDKWLGSLPVIGKPSQFLSTLVMPYRQFPVNFVTEAVDYVFPAVSVGKGIYHATKGAQRESTEMLGKAALGATMYAGAAYLYESGLITPEIHFKDKKLKQLSYNFAQPPGTINMSGLDRLLKGGSAEFQQGDRVMNYEKLGIPGIIMHLESQLQWSGKKQAAEGKIVPKAEWWERAMPIRDPGESLNYMVEATPLMGAAGFLTALQDWDANGERFIKDMYNATTAVAVPNAVTAAFKTQYERIPELQGSTQAETFKNIWNYKTLNLEGDFPTKVGLFGEQVLRTPEGVNPWQYHLLNPVDLRKANSKAEYNLIEGLYRKTGDASVIPGHPSRTFKDPRTGQSYKLDAANYALLQQHVGKARLGLMKESIMQEEGVADWSNEEIVAYMNKVNRMGLKLGKANYLADKKLDLSKAEKVGEPEGMSGAMVRDLIESVSAKRN